MKLNDVELVKCEEYNPFSPKANSLGMKSFWRATYKDETIAISNTKAECLKKVRRYISVQANAK